MGGIKVRELLNAGPSCLNVSPTFRNLAESVVSIRI